MERQNIHPFPQPRQRKPGRQQAEGKEKQVRQRPLPSKGNPEDQQTADHPEFHENFSGCPALGGAGQKSGAQQAGQVRRPQDHGHPVKAAVGAVQQCDEIPKGGDRVKRRPGQGTQRQIDQKALPPRILHRLLPFLGPVVEPGEIEKMEEADKQCRSASHAVPAHSR